jgi:hypothetical protein
MELFETAEKKGAKFSDCRNYRYALWRIWDDSKPFVMFIGLNPSTANEDADDPTIRRVKSFAKAWGYGGVYMMNLFAIVSSKPEVLKTCADAIGDNDTWLSDIAQKCSQVVFAWGNFKEATERSKVVAANFPEAKALEINKSGTPKHPLYVRGDIVPVIFQNR